MTPASILVTAGEKKERGWESRREKERGREAN
jgi:hypothetical protein